MTPRFWTTLAVLCFGFGPSRAQQDTVWTEDFEIAPESRWYPTSGVWQFGSPAAGPSSAHTGTNCAGPVFTGSYPNSVSTHLLSISPITIPSAQENPRLRFWHWYELDLSPSYDHGVVQVTTDGGSTWTTLPTTAFNGNYEGTCSGVWTQEEIDLRGFADSSVQLGFHFTSGGSGSSFGWYVDDLMILTGYNAHYNPEGFESGWHEWSADRGTWEIGIPTSGPMAAYSGTRCAATVLGGNYHDIVASRLKTTWIQLPPSGASPGLGFHHWYSFDTSPSADNGTVQLRSWNDPENWVTLTTSSFVGSSGGWTNYYIPLTAFADSLVQLAFYFQSGGSGSSAGWYIDDVNITGLPDTSFANGGGGTQVGWLTEISEPQIHPVPASDHFFITTDHFSAPIEVTLCDMAGHVIQSFKMQNVAPIPTLGIAEGCYLVMIRVQGKVTHKRLIIAGR